MNLLQAQLSYSSSWVELGIISKLSSHPARPNQYLVRPDHYLTRLNPTGKVNFWAIKVNQSYFHFIQPFNLTQLAIGWYPNFAAKP